MVLNVATKTFRPCCDNSTFYQDCNHGSKPAELHRAELAAAVGGIGRFDRDTPVVRLDPRQVVARDVAPLRHDGGPRKPRCVEYFGRRQPSCAGTTICRTRSCRWQARAPQVPVNERRIFARYSRGDAPLMDI